MELGTAYLIISVIVISILSIPTWINLCKDLCEGSGLPDWMVFERNQENWMIFETAEERERRERQEKDKSILEELIKKHNVPTKLQKDLGFVTDKYFLIKRFFNKFKECGYYWIYSRQPDGTLGERKGEVELPGRSPFAIFESDDLNAMCDKVNTMCDQEVQAEPLIKRFFNKFKECGYYWSDDLNAMCDKVNTMCDQEVQAEPLKRRCRVMRERVDKLNS